MALNSVIRAKSLMKSFGAFKAVDGIDLEIAQGECFGLLGPNGAGKSTFINMLYGASLRSSGDLRVFGLDPTTQSREIKKQLGVVTQENALDESLTVLENMIIYAAFKGMPRRERQKSVLELLDYMNLSHKKDAKIQTLSGGMRRRLVFVRALLGSPDLVILDEPTTGLDPAVRHLLWGKIKELKDKGATILVTTHYMHEAEILCDRVAVMNKGQILSIGSPVHMIHNHAPGFVGVFARDVGFQETWGQVTQQQEGWITGEDSSGYYLRTKSLEELVALQKKWSLRCLQMRPANLEDVFLKLTGEELSSND